MVAVDSTPKRPLLRYHGGKWKLADWIIAQFPEHRVYVEPFGGGASVLLRKPRARAEIYNDVDGEIVNIFRVMRDRGAELIDKLRLTPFARAEFELSRERTADPIEQARRSIVRSFMGYGTTMTRINVTDGEIQRTGFRRLRRDSTTTAADWANLPEHFEVIRQRLQGVTIEQSDACRVMLEHDSAETLHYVDPPYVHSTRSARAGRSRHGYRFELTDEQHEELGRVLNGLQGAVIVSGYASELYEELFAGWDRLERGHHALNAADRTEVLWMRNCERGLFANLT